MKITSESWDMEILTSVFAAGWTTSRSLMIVAPSFEIVTPCRGKLTLPIAFDNISSKILCGLRLSLQKGHSMAGNCLQQKFKLSICRYKQLTLAIRKVSSSLSKAVKTDARYATLCVGQVLKMSWMMQIHYFCNARLMLWVFPLEITMTYATPQSIELAAVANRLLWNIHLPQLNGFNVNRHSISAYVCMMRSLTLESCMSLSMPLGPSVDLTASTTAQHALMLLISCALPWLVSVPSFRRIIWGCCTKNNRNFKSLNLESYNPKSSLESCNIYSLFRKELSRLKDWTLEESLKQWPYLLFMLKTISLQEAL